MSSTVSLGIRQVTKLNYGIFIPFNTFKDYIFNMCMFYVCEVLGV